jgi:hypothetical protein
MRRASQGQWSDFRSAPDLPYWRVNRDVCVSSADGLWEVPIASAPVRRLKQLSNEIQARRTSNSRFAPSCQGAYATPSSGGWARLSGNIQKLIDLGLAKLDFSTMPAETLIAVTQSWLNRFGHLSSIPVVGIAHTKNWTERSDASSSDYFAWARDAGLRFSTYPAWVDSLAQPAGTSLVNAAV